MSNGQSAMDNRHQHGSSELLSNRDVLLGELRQFGTERRLLDLDSGSPASKPLLHGQFRYRTVCDGLSMHCGLVTELESTTRQFELKSGISINFLFEGWVDFSVLGRYYQMESLSEGTLCTLLCLNKPELITRYFQQDRRVGKLNLYVAYDWLVQRCQSPEERIQLTELFAEHSNVAQFRVSDESEHLVRSLMSACQAGLPNQLRIEQQLIALLSATLDQWLSQADVLPVVGMEQEHNLAIPERQSLWVLLEQAVEHNMELEQIAQMGNLSISTLQRRVKREFGLTVMEYMRQRRLALARDALVCEGVTIGEAAHRAGYRHASNFCTAFKRYFSITPEEMVQAHRR